MVSEPPSTVLGSHHSLWMTLDGHLFPHGLKTVGHCPLHAMKSTVLVLGSLLAFPTFPTLNQLRYILARCRPRLAVWVRLSDAAIFKAGGGTVWSAVFVTQII
jgi:hypothetical protein